MDGLVPLCQVVSSYERCAGIPIGTDGKADWRIKYVDFNPKDMIRTISATSEEDVHEKIEGLLHDSTRNRGLPWWEIVRVEAPKGCRSAIVIRYEGWREGRSEATAKVLYRSYITNNLLLFAPLLTAARLSQD